MSLLFGRAIIFPERLFGRTGKSWMDEASRDGMLLGRAVWWKDFHIENELKPIFGLDDKSSYLGCDWSYIGLTFTLAIILKLATL